MKFKLLILIAILVVSLLTGLLVYISLVFDPNILISQITYTLETNYNLKTKYKFVNKNILSLINGIKFEDIEIYSKNNKKLISSKRVYININLLSILNSPEITSINIISSKANLNHILEYLNSKEGQKIFSQENTNNYGGININYINFSDIEVLYEGKKLKLDYLNLNTKNFSVNGYLANTRSKFLFDGTNFLIDKLDGSEIIGNINLNKIEGKIIEGEKIVSYIKTATLSNISVLENINIIGNLKNLQFILNISNTSLVEYKDLINLNNITIYLSVKNNIIGNFDLLDTISCNFSIIKDNIKGKLKIKDFSNKQIPTVFSKISNIIEKFITKGEISFNVNPKQITLSGNLNLDIYTNLKNNLLKNLKVTMNFRGIDLETTIYSKTPKSDIKIDSLISFDRELKLRKIDLTSSKIDTYDITQGQNHNESNNQISVGIGKIPIKIDNVPIDISVNEIILGKNTPKIFNLSMSGNVNFDVNRFSVSLDEISFIITGAKVLAKGDFEYGDKLKLNFKFLPIEINLFTIYSNINLSDIGGKVLGKGFLKNLEISISNNIYAKGSLYISNVELIEIQIQNELTKLLNLDLRHIFIDKGELEFEVVTNMLKGIGNITGDVVSEFSFFSNESKLKVKFEYIKIDRSIIENVPKIFFVRNEINGIKYKIDEKYLSFDKFEIEVFY
ncbi:MAG: hypothetical protein ACK4F9_01245 [Brevinematia bacterium]